MSRISDDLEVAGTLTANVLQPTAGTVTNDTVALGAAIGVTKLKHLHKVSTDFGVANNAVPSADVQVEIFRATGACTIRRVDCKLFSTGAATDIKFDLHKAAAASTSLATVLSATVDFTNADADNTAKAGTISAATLVAGDVLVAKMDWTSADATGPFMSVEIDEAAN